MDCENYPTVKRKKPKSPERPADLADAGDKQDVAQQGLTCTCGRKGQLPRRPQYEEPSHQGAPLEPDDELDGDTSPTGGFRRGTRARTSLPLIRSPNRSMERPIGQLCNHISYDL
ncbi:hypothetical protein CAPTEDRAFT_206585 [Capitella teleta]|uniref:Uncharacterized protein n=1 Tax=Capitella teleta TaxID=283909 RepID=R7U2P7_CAPTE|nr:hypothetical protein CAPTEDRAFT_206585 [Capitella teleta]|eukprot:ELU00620.1 hypothetical protein CAPTEDRAFT_206585 [Capitella teleta]